MGPINAKRSTFYLGQGILGCHSLSRLPFWPHKHPHSLQSAIHTQLAHHYIQMLYELFRFWTTSGARIIVLAAGSTMGTWLLYSDSVRQSLEDEGLCLVLQLWPWWLAFCLTKSSLCFFFANLYGFLLSISSSLVPRSSASYLQGLSGLRCLGSNTYNYLQDGLWDLMHYPSFQANSAKCIHWYTLPQSTLVIIGEVHLYSLVSIRKYLSVSIMRLQSWGSEFFLNLEC